MIPANFAPRVLSKELRGHGTHDFLVKIIQIFMGYSRGSI